MSVIKSVLKGFLRLLIQLIKPFGVLAKYFYLGVKAVLKPVVKVTTYLLKQLFLMLKRVVVATYNYILKPIYLLIKKVVLGIYFIIKQLSLFVYRWILKPLYFVLKKIALGVYFIFKKSAMIAYRFLLLPLYKLLKKVFLGFWLSIKFISKRVYLYILKPLYHLLKWVYSILKMGLRFIWQILKTIGRWFKAIYNVLKHITLKILNFVKPFFLWLYHFFVDILKLIKWVIVCLYKGIRFIFIGVYRALVNIFLGLKFLINKLIRSIHKFIDWVVYLYRNQPEWLYISQKWVWTQVLLVLEALLIWIPKLIVVNVILWSFKWVYHGLRQLIYVLIYCLQKVIVFLINQFTKLRQIMYPLRRVITDLVFDFKDYYYIWLLSPILLPTLIIFGLFVFIEVIMIHLWILFKVFFNIQNNVLKEVYLPSINIFKFSRRFITLQKQKMGYQQKFRNAHSLMILFIWPLSFFMRLLLSFVLLPWTIFILTFYGILYFKNRDQIEFVIDDYIKMPDQVYGVLEAMKVKRYGHVISLYVKEAILDSDLNVYVIDKNLETVRVEVWIDDQMHQAYTILNKPSAKMSLLYDMNCIQAMLKTQQTSTIALPKFEDITINYQITHQADDIHGDILYLRPHANTTDLLIKITENDISYEKEVAINSIQTDVLERILLTDVFYGYQGLSVKHFLDPKLNYTFLPNEDLKNDIIHSKKQYFSVTFQVIGKEDMYTINIQIVPSPLDLLAFERALQTPVYDKLSKSYKLPNTIILFGLIHQLEWFVDSKAFEQVVSLADLAITQYHTFVVRVFDGYRTYEKTLTYEDERFKTAIYDIEFQAILSNLRGLCLNEGICEVESTAHLSLPNSGLKYIKRLLWVSQDPKIIKSTGLIKQSGIVRFKVVLYKHLFIKKVVFIKLSVKKTNSDVRLD